MKTFSIASDITHLIFSTSFYLDELNPVTACDPDPHNFELSHIHDDRNFIDRIYAFFIHTTTRNELS